MQLNFDARTVAPSTAPEPVETGTYPVVIKAAQEKPTRANDGSSFLELTLEVMHGPAQGKRIIDRLNLKNSNPQAVEIAYGQLSAICHVTGRLQIANEQQLLGATTQVYAVKEPRNDAPGQYSNAVKGYKDMNGNEPGQAGQHGNMQQQGGGQQFGGVQQGGMQQGQNFGGQQQGGFDPNAQQGQFGGGQQGGMQQQGGFAQGGQQQGQFNGQGGQQQGGFDPNAQQGGYQQQGQNFNGAQQQGGMQQGGMQQQGGGQGFGGPAAGGGAPSWA